MSYRFPLAPVLRIRELAAEQEEARLSRIHAEIHALEAALARNRAEQAQTREARQSLFAASALPAMHLHALHSTLEDLQGREAQLRRQLSAAETLRLEQMSQYRKAWEQREVLATLRAEQQTAWAAGERRREARAADESFLNGYARKLTEKSR